MPNFETIATVSMTLLVPALMAATALEPVPAPNTVQTTDAQSCLRAAVAPVCAAVRA